MVSYASYKSKEGHEFIYKAARLSQLRKCHSFKNTDSNLVLVVVVQFGMSQTDSWHRFTSDK